MCAKDLKMEDFSRLLMVLIEDSETKVEAWIHLNRLFVTNEDGNLDFMLRWCSHTKGLTIARMYMSHPGQGVGTRVLRQVESLLDQHGFTHINIESATSESMNRFANTHGFDLIGNPGLMNNYIKMYGGDSNATKRGRRQV
jgi:hypothetical protein